jgi:DNA-binding response OmpR family regulator
MFGKVLLVENDIDTANIICFILAEENFDVHHTRTVDLKRCIDSMKPDLIILDHLLEYGITGAHLCKQLKSNHDNASPFIILMSATTNLDHIARDCDADAYINKPFDITDFCNTVKDVLSL